MEKIYEGKAKIVYREADGRLVHYFKDSATAFNAQKKAEFKGKGELNNAISCRLLQFLKSKGIPSHYVERIDERSFRSLALQMLPVEVVIRNKLAGSLAKRLHEKEGQDLNPVLVEFYLKDDEKGDPLVSKEILIALYKQNISDLNLIQDLALQVNTHLRPVFEKAGLILVDFKLEFGKDASGQIRLADEISPDTCRLWDLKSGVKFDKDRFRFDLGDLIEGYQEVLFRLNQALPEA